ncbi:hypothetical protein ASE16_07580 [Leifsonia sp. Root227]|nr:hypothetical protein ASE16_07580 [Leifsonia sp. Root227]
MLASIARFEVRRKGERQQRANAARADKGVPLMGRRPFGWEVDQVTVRESEAEAIRWAYSQVLAGASLYSVVKAWNDQSITSAQGNAWSTAQLRKMFKRERNYGALLYKGTVSEDSAIEPIVTKDQWQAVVAILEGRSTAGKGRKPVHSFLTNVVTCGVCGSRMRANWVTFKGKRTRNYLCETKLDRRLSDGRTHVGIAAHIIEPEVVTALWMTLVVQGGRAEQADDAEVLRLRIALSDIERRRRAVQELWLEDGADHTHLRKLLAGLGSEWDKTNQALTAILSENVGKGLSDALREAFIPSGDEQEHATALGGSKEAFVAAFESMSTDAQRELVRANLSVQVNPGYGGKRVEIAPR